MNDDGSINYSDTPMGATGFATSGGVIYNHLANPDGSVAWYDEIASLDVSMGHSDPSANYHYHGVSTCVCVCVCVNVRVYSDI